MTPPAKSAEGERVPVDAVLLIDGDNDPHIPPNFPITESTLVRVFLRPDGKLPRPLERRLGSLPLFVTVASTKGGSNAADFVMSLHVGILHATLPLHLPFMVVTADRSLSVVTQELQRVGRQATLWTSHPERGGRARRGEPAEAAEAETPAPSAPRSGSTRRRRGRRSSGGSSRRAAAPAAVPVPAAPAAESAPPPPGGRSLAEVAAAYAARLNRIKDPPSRLKTLINDIANRAGASGYTPELILDELKLRHGVVVDASGRVKIVPAIQGA